MTLLSILLAALYVACWVYFGLATFRKATYWLFLDRISDFSDPWIIGAFMAPTERAPPHAPPARSTSSWLTDSRADGVGASPQLTPHPALTTSEHGTFSQSRWTPVTR